MVERSSGLLAAALRRFSDAVELDTFWIANAKARAVHIGTLITEDPRVETCFPMGSLMRGTTIQKFSDIDIVALMDYRSANITPRDLVTNLSGIVAAAYPDFKESGTALRLEFSDGLDVDIVPAVRDDQGSKIDGNSYLVPSGDMQHWLSYNPIDHDQRMDKAARNIGPDFKRLVRLVKWWNASNGRFLLSFEIERLAHESFVDSTLDIPAAFAAVLDSAVEKGVATTDTEVESLQAARIAVERSIEFAMNEDIQSAVDIWRGLLGGDFGVDLT